MVDPYGYPRQYGEQSLTHHAKYPVDPRHVPAYPSTWPNPPPPLPYQPSPEYHTVKIESVGRQQSAGTSVPFPPMSSSRGRDYLLSLTTDMSNLDLANIHPRARTLSDQSQTDKPLPRLPPPPPLPQRPLTTYAVEGCRSTLTPDRENGRLPSSQQPHSSRYHADALPVPPLVDPFPSTPPRTSRPSPHVLMPYIKVPSSEPRPSRPNSDPSVPYRKKKDKGRTASSAIVIVDSGSDTSSDCPTNVTKRSPARRIRAMSEQPLGKPTPSSRKSTSGTSVKCAGFTRKGQPCQRLVKMEAPYLSRLNPNLPEDERVVARYCRDHAGMICSAEGFYWRGTKEGSGVWIDFSDYIPDDLGQQTKALLRMTMESPLTDKEAAGYLYAYEIRDLLKPSTAFFKVGRTDNVSRRIGEWSLRCHSHAPTIRDYFPLHTPSSARQMSHSGASVTRHPSLLPNSYLPGAMRHSTNPDRTCPAVKRWERLVHLELADRSSQLAPKEYDGLKEKCRECDVVHKEIFPLRNDVRIYEDVVREAICRWERFVRKISAE